MANPFNMPQLFQMPTMPDLPVLYESLIGSPQAESLDVEGSLFDNQYKTQKFWNEGNKVGGGQSYEQTEVPTQFKDPALDMYNEFSGVYYL